MQTGVWSIAISILALYISIVSMTKSMRHDLIMILYVVLFVVFFKPIVLWGANGAFRAIANATLLLSSIATALLFLFSHHIPFKEKPWAQLTMSSAALLACILYWAFGCISSVAVRADIPTYLQLLSSEHKITLDTFYVLATYYPITLYLAFAIFQTALLFFVSLNILFSLPHMVHENDFAMPHKGWTKTVVATLIFISTDWLRTALVKLLAYFF